MKKLLYKTLFILLASFASTGLSAQCGPDPDYSFCYASGETDLVKLEICMSGIVEATICKGNYESGWDFLTVYEGAAGSGSSGTVVMNPTDGNLSGTQLSTTGTGNCLIFISNTDGSISCEEGDFNSVEIFIGSCPAQGPFDFEYCYQNEENNTVMFEICGNADEYINSTICQGTLETTFDDLTVYDGPAGSETNGTIVFGPEEGDLSGTEIFSITPGNCLIFVVNSDFSNSCEEDGFDPFGVIFETGLGPCGADENSLVTTYCYGDDEIDNVILEVCGASNEYVSSFICDGFLETGFDEITVYEGAEGSGINGSVVFGPSSGAVGGSQMGTSDTGNCLSFVINSDSSVNCESSEYSPLLIISDVGTTSSIDENYSDLSKVYPNPFSEEIMFEATLNHQETGRLYLTGLDGKRINLGNRQLVAGVNQIRIETNNVPAGIYMLGLESETYNLQKRVIKLD